MKVHHIGEKNSILHRFIGELRAIDIQKDSMRFRRNIERVGEILSYELSKSLEFQETSIKTPLGINIGKKLKDKIVICSVLRAGLPMHQGVLNYFDNAENCFISAYRKHNNKVDFNIKVEYISGPSIENKILFITDPMLATGKSLVNVYEAIKTLGTPKQIHLLSVIGAPEGISYINTSFPVDTQLWIAAIDEKLNDKGYIIPGLGDAGDLAFGTKLQQ